MSNNALKLLLPDLQSKFDKDYILTRTCSKISLELFDVKAAFTVVMVIQILWSFDTGCDRICWGTMKVVVTANTRTLKLTIPLVTSLPMSGSTISQWNSNDDTIYNRIPEDDEFSSLGIFAQIGV